MNRLKIIAAMTVALSLSAVTVRADDWPGYRGPHRDGKSAETGLLQTWPTGGPMLLATIDHIGGGLSGPAVVNGRIYLTALRDGKEFLTCYDDKTKIWERAIGQTAEIKPSVLPRSTPSIADGRAYVRSLDGHVLAMNTADGSIAWNVDLVKEFKATLSSEGVAESLLIDGDNVICTTGGPDSGIIALDRDKGSAKWKCNEVGNVTAISSAIAFDFAGVHQIAQATGKSLVGLRATDGKLLWKIDLNVKIAAPVFIDGIIYAGPTAVRIKGDASLFQAEIIPTAEIKSPHNPAKVAIENSPEMGCVSVNGLVFGGRSNAANSAWPDSHFVCAHLSTGELKYVETESRAAGPLIYADGRLYCQTNFGRMDLVDPAAKSRQITGQFFFPFIYPCSTACPAISNGKLYIRGSDTLTIYDIKNAPANIPSVIQTTTPTPSTAPASNSKDWPQFRGQLRDGCASPSETGLLKSWPKTGPPLLKSIDVGFGYASAAIVAGRVYIPGEITKDTFVFCLDKDKDYAEVWRTKIDADGKNYGMGGRGPCSTPTIENGILYVLSRQGKMVAMNAVDGSVIWTVDTLVKFGGKPCEFGYTQSPLIDGDRIICTPGGPDATVVALDKKTGNTVWTSKGLSDGAHTGNPILVNFKSIPLIIAWSKIALVCVDARDGKFYWRYEAPSTPAGNYSTPIYNDDGVIYAANGHSAIGGAVKLSLDDAGQIHGTQIWNTDQINGCHSDMIRLGQYLYGCGEPHCGPTLNWTWCCVDTTTGTVTYNKSQNVNGPILYADGLFYHLNLQWGGMSLIKATPTDFKTISSFDFGAIGGALNSCPSFPTISDGRLYVRTNKLFIFDIRDHAGSHE